MLEYSIEYSVLGPENMDPIHRGMLTALVGEYRRSSLSHFSSGFAGNSRGVANISDMLVAI